MNITNIIVDHIKHNKPITFMKMGDGEFNCVFDRNGHNCDNDMYTQKLSNELAKSFKYMVENGDHHYMGLWHNLENRHRWEKCVNKPVKWVNYHSLIFDKDHTYNVNKIEIYKELKYSKRKKIMVCNELLIKSKSLLNIDELVIVPYNNWFDTQFETVLQSIKDIIDEDSIVLTSCGMSAKVLLCRLYQLFPNGIYLDVGSGLDLLCTKKHTRNYDVTYDNMVSLFRELLPPDWDDTKYDSIYEQANHKLGLHLCNR